MTLSELVAGGGLFVLTGAGLSTESGIPDYRRADGTRRTVPMTFQQFMASPAARRRYWARSAAGWETFARAQPNIGHEAVTRLQRMGFIDHVVTQNVDGLHTRAGTRDVTDLHGNLQTVICVNCRATQDRAIYQARLRAMNPQLPTSATLLADGDADIKDDLERGLLLVACDVCGSDTMKPNVVMFGEAVDTAVVAGEFSHLHRSRGVLVLGSSLRVMSGYRFVLAAHKTRTPIALVGLGEMRGEERADIVVHAPLGRTLEQLVTDLGA